ncbi:hypothetical protein AK812_SmicGene23987 [Symbiodinium microadriaticum]|uniref:CCHC-type domain-containing protein n=1 Tax=Symbiodinium microadriaticum TaxID=2951 RepID=A0A1Q9DFU2_SYMMI|nr:hypothetical protein AK812_SmicGene23987 [Symbiodinium microadriaticum]
MGQSLQAESYAGDWVPEPAGEDDFNGHVQKIRVSTNPDRVTFEVHSSGYHSLLCGDVGDDWSLAPDDVWNLCGTEFSAEALAAVEADSEGNGFSGSLEWRHQWIAESGLLRTELHGPKVCKPEGPPSETTLRIERKLLSADKMMVQLQIVDEEVKDVSQCIYCRTAATSTTGPSPVSFLRVHGRPLKTLEDRLTVLDKVGQLVADSCEEISQAQATDRACDQGAALTAAAEGSVHWKVKRRRWSHSGDTGGVSSGGPDGSSGYESEEKQSAPRRDGWDGWAEDGSWFGGSFSEAFGTWRGRRGFNENWSWKSDVEPDTTIKDDPNDEEIEDLRGKVKVVGGQAGPERKGTGKVSNTYPPVFRAKPQESYQEWKRSVEFWIGGEGEQLPVELIGPRMMVQLKDRAAQLVKHLNINDVNGPNGKQIIFKELEKSPLIKQVDRHRVDEHRRRLMQLNRAPGESMESYVTRAGVYRSHLLGVDPGMAMGEAFYVGHLLDHAKLTKRDRAMIKTKAGGLTDEEKVTSAMIELASEMDGESGFPVGASEPNLARNGEEWLLQRDRALRGAFLAEADEESVLGEDFGGEADGPEADAAPPELLHLEHEAFGTQFKARQKIAEVRKLRQYYQKPDTEEKKKWLTEQMKKNPCHACGQLGHWSRECPMKAQQVLFAKSRAATSTPVPSRVATIPEEDEGAEWALLASLCSKGAGSLDAGSRATEQYMGATGVFLSVRESATKQVHTAFSTVSMGLYDVCWSMQQLAFKVILDIGCMRSVVGVRWATEVLERWKAEGRWHRVEKENEAFRFGDGEVLHSRYRMEFIGSFAGKPVVYGFSFVEGVCPPLFSRSGCTQLGVVIDCEHHSISSRRLGIKSFGLGRAEGHYTLCIDDSGMDVAAIDLPRDFRLGAGMDAMSICSEVLPEKPEKSRDCPTLQNISDEEDFTMVTDQGEDKDPLRRKAKQPPPRAAATPMPPTSLLSPAVNPVAVGSSDLTAEEIALLTKRRQKAALAKSKAQQHRALTVEKADYPSLSHVWSAEVGLNLAAATRSRMVTFGWKRMLWQLRVKQAIEQEGTKRWKRNPRWLAMLFGKEVAALWGHFGAMRQKINNPDVWHLM